MQRPANITSNVKHSPKSSSHQTTHLPFVKSTHPFTTRHISHLSSERHLLPHRANGRGDRDEPARGLINLPKILAVLLLLCAAAAPRPASASVVLAHANTTSLSTGLIGYWPLDGNTINWKTGQ